MSRSSSMSSQPSNVLATSVLNVFSENHYPSSYTGRAYNNVTRKQNQSSRRSTTTSSALALLAFLFFLNVLQRSLDDNKQGPMVMTRTTTKHTIPRNDLTENKQVITTTSDNIYVTKNENIFNKYLKLN